MRGYLVILLGTVLTVQANNETESKVVQIAQGQVRGYKEPDYNVFAFYDIPYATTTERFKASTAPPTWNETFEAVQRRIVCPQFRQIENATMQEDCLVANIFIPSTEKMNLPVIVNVHGGAFEVGFGTDENHRTLVQDKEVISVTFNYRLGVLGFLCMGTKGAPGNAGLKDQLTLLRWVKENIASFGGNADDVTISGCSAGSASVDILALSNSAKGLFTKVISNSGAQLGTFAVQQDPIQNAKDAAQLLGFQNIDDLVELEEFYKNAPVSLLTSRSYTGNKNSAVYFSPCVEKDLGEEAILLESPYNILKSGQHVRYPTLAGFTDLEGSENLRFFSDWSLLMNERFSDFLPGDLQFETKAQKEEVAKNIKQFYFGDQQVGTATILSYLDYSSDVKFVYPVMRSVKFNAEAGNTKFFLHEYSFVDNNSMTIPYTNVTGAFHCAQARAVQDENETTITEEYRSMKRIMKELWGNFIKTGIPVTENSTLPSWPPAGGDRSPHMSMASRATLELKGIPVEERTRLWDDIYARYYRIPIPPSTGSATAIRSVYLIYISIICYLL